MAQEEKKRTFESEALILPALRMVLVESENNTKAQAGKQFKRKYGKELKEDAVMRIIGKLSLKD